MKIGIPKEIKNNENRVAVTPSSVNNLVGSGHNVYIETGAGLNSGFSDTEYQKAGAEIVQKAQDVWSKEMVVKIKEPLPKEYKFFHEGLILFAFLHLAAEPELTKALVENKVVAIAYETVQLEDHSLPLLTPMSQVAGRLAPQIGAHFLEKTHGGSGVLLSGIPGVMPSNITIIGGGVVGTNAAEIAVGIGANVTIIDLSPERLGQLDDLFGNQVNTIMSNTVNIAKAVKESDLVIGSVLIPGAKAPQLVNEDMIRSMQEGSVVIDVAIDQGGNFETSDKVTSHDDPVYTKHGVIHYTVGNIPGAAPRTATIGLSNVTTPYMLNIANMGYSESALQIPAISKGISTLGGYVTQQAVADTHKLEYKQIGELLK